MCTYKVRHATPVHIRVCVRVCVCEFVSMHVQGTSCRTCAYTCVCVCVRACLCGFVCVHAQGASCHTCAYTYVCVQVCLCARTRYVMPHLCIYVCVRACVTVRVCLCARTGCVMPHLSIISHIQDDLLAFVQPRNAHTCALESSACTCCYILPPVTARILCVCCLSVRVCVSACVCVLLVLCLHLLLHITYTP